MESPRFRLGLPKSPHEVKKKIYNNRNLWILITALFWLWNTLSLSLSHSPPKYQCINLFLWLGILISLEDQLSSLYPRPSKVSAFLGLSMLTLAILRGSIPVHQSDKFLSFELPLISLGLCLLNRPVCELKFFQKPLLIAFLWQIFTPIRIVLNWLFGSILPKISAFLTWLLMHGLGFKVSLSGKTVLTSHGGIDVLLSCAGLEQAVFSLLIVAVFLIVFPLRKVRSILLVLTLAMPIAVLCNVVRLSILAYFTGLPGESGLQYFDFLHESYGGLIFSMISASIVGHLYLLALNQDYAHK